MTVGGERARLLIKGPEVTVHSVTSPEEQEHIVGMMQPGTKFMKWRRHWRRRRVINPSPAENPGMNYACVLEY